MNLQITNLIVVLTNLKCAVLQLNQSNTWDDRMKKKSDFENFDLLLSGIELDYICKVGFYNSIA